jgi:integrase/recombinase XerD
MTTITLKPLYHRGGENIALIAPNQPKLNLAIRKLPKAKWSQSNKCWYIPLNKDSHKGIKDALKALAVIDDSLLKQYLHRRKEVEKTQMEPLRSSLPSNPRIALPMSAAWKLNKENLQALQRFMEQLKLKAYSPSTIQTYRNEFLQLLKLLKQKPVSELTSGELRRYFLYCFEKLKLTENTLHSRINAIKFYFEQVLGRERFFWEIPRPRKKTELPRMFTQEEVTAIINSTVNKKHKTMLMLAYSAGLRVSEVVSLKTADIDSTRMTITIRQAKGKKDRLAALSPVLLVMLREYARVYKPLKNGFLFEGSGKDSPYSSRSLQEVLQAAKKKAGIIRAGSIHSLRHSFATHLVDRGTDISMIQKLLGHNSIKTTLRYLHTSNKDLLKIISPLDDLKLNP